MKKVMVFGTFDIIHPGHIFLFNEAKNYGDYLIVVVSRDKNAKKEIVNNEGSRLAAVKRLKEVDHAILGDEKDKIKVIAELRPDVICLGYDQKIGVAELKRKIKKIGSKIRVYRIKAFKPEIYKSSLFRV